MVGLDKPIIHSINSHPGHNLQEMMEASFMAVNLSRIIRHYRKEFSDEDRSQRMKAFLSLITFNMNMKFMDVPGEFQIDFEIAKMRVMLEILTMNKQFPHDFEDSESEGEEIEENDEEIEEDDEEIEEENENDF